MSGFRRDGRTPLMVLGVLGALLVLILAVPAARAETGTRALVLGSSVEGGASSPEATQAAADGFTVDVVDDPTWAAMTKDGFAAYQMVIVGDPSCGSLSEVVSQNAQALADAVMDNGTENTRSGNRVLIGTDPDFHESQGGGKMIASAVDFVSVVDGATSLYLNFTCSDDDYDADGTGDGQQKLLPLLSFDPAPTWSQNAEPPCGGDVSLIANNDQFSPLTSADIRGWGCSVHETFPQYPTDWNPLAIATDVPTKPTCGNDVDTGTPACGEAYLLIAGSGIVATAPDLALDPTTATRDAGSAHTVTATVTKPDKSPRPDVAVSFVVTGVNPGASGTCVPASCQSDANGKVTFTYTGTNVGDDTVNASMVVDGSKQTATAAVTWVTPAPTPTPTPTTSPTPTPTVDVLGDVSRSCSGRRRFRIVLRNQKRIRYRSATFTLGGKKIKTRRFGRKIGAIVDLRKMGKRTITLRITAVTSDGRKLKGKRVYHPCTKKRKKTPPKL